MKKILIALVGCALTNIAVAAPPTFIEGAFIFGGENARNGGGKQNGIEAVGSWGINDNWYIGGILGYYDAKDFAENTYGNINGGYVKTLSQKTSLLLEGGLWFGEQEFDGGGKTKPSAIEAKAGINHSITPELSIFGTLAIVGADLDTDVGNDDLSNFIWSLGGAYAFSDLFSLNLKVVNGVNGVNGQDEVLRLGARWTF